MANPLYYLETLNYDPFADREVDVKNINYNKNWHGFYFVLDPTWSLLDVDIKNYSEDTIKQIIFQQCNFFLKEVSRLENYNNVNDFLKFHFIDKIQLFDNKSLTNKHYTFFATIIKVILNSVNDDIKSNTYVNQQKRRFLEKWIKHTKDKYQLDEVAITKKSNLRYIESFPSKYSIKQKVDDRIDIADYISKSELDIFFRRLTVENKKSGKAILTEEEISILLHSNFTFYNNKARILIDTKGRCTQEVLIYYILHTFLNVILGKPKRDKHIRDKMCDFLIINFLTFQDTEKESLKSKIKSKIPRNYPKHLIIS